MTVQKILRVMITLALSLLSVSGYAITPISDVIVDRSNKYPTAPTWQAFKIQKDDTMWDVCYDLFVCQKRPNPKNWSEHLRCYSSIVQENRSFYPATPTLEDLKRFPANRRHLLPVCVPDAVERQQFVGDDDRLKEMASSVQALATEVAGVKLVADQRFSSAENKINELETQIIELSRQAIPGGLIMGVLNNLMSRLVAIEQGKLTPEIEAEIEKVTKKSLEEVEQRLLSLEQTVEDHGLRLEDHDDKLEWLNRELSLLREQVGVQDTLELLLDRLPAAPSSAEASPAAESAENPLSILGGSCSACSRHNTREAIPPCVEE